MKPSARKQIIEDAFINLSKKYNLEYMHGFIANKPLLSGKIETLTIKIEDTFDMENKDIIRIRINAPNNFPYSFILYSGKSLHSFYSNPEIKGNGIIFNDLGNEIIIWKFNDKGVIALFNKEVRDLLYTLFNLPVKLFDLFFIEGTELHVSIYFFRPLINFENTLSSIINILIDFSLCMLEERIRTDCLVDKILNDTNSQVKKMNLELLISDYSKKMVR